VGYDWVCPLQEVSPETAAGSAEARRGQASSGQAPCTRAPSTGEGPIVMPKMRVRRTQGPTRRDWTPPGPSRLRETVQAQDNEKLDKLHRDFERFRITGKQPPVSVPIGGPKIIQYSPSGSSTYRPFSAPLNTTDPLRRDARHDLCRASQSSDTSRRLGSMDLFPDRYRQEARPAISPTPARNSVSGLVDPLPEDASKDSSADAPNDSSDDGLVLRYPQFEIDSRRARANSDRSDRSSSSSTESSRARKSLAYRLDKDKAAWSPNASKSTASVSFAGFKNAMRSIANTFMPSGGESEAENVTRELSRSPRRSGDRAADLDDGSETEQAGEDAHPVRSSRRRSRKNALAGSSLDPSAGRVDGSETEQTGENARPVSSSRRPSWEDAVAGSSGDRAGGRVDGSDTEQASENARPGRSVHSSSCGHAGLGEASEIDQALEDALQEIEIAEMNDAEMEKEIASMSESEIIEMLFQSSPLEEATNDRNVVSGEKQGPTTSEFHLLVY